MADRANQQQQDALRRPNIITTSDFLKNPIEFNNDQRFDLASAVSASADFTTMERDQASFVVLDLNAADAQYFVVEMYSNAANRADYTKVIDKKAVIQQLLADEQNQ
jgi:hypothetical protein